MPADAAPATFVGAIITAVRSFDQHEIRAALDRASEVLGVTVTLDEVVMASVRVVELFRSNGTVDLSHAHALATAVSRWVTGQAALSPSPSRSSLILLCSGPDDEHTVALDCLHLLLRQQGVEVLNLGAQPPADSVAYAARTVRPGAVVVISNTPTAASRAVRSVAVVAETGFPLYYAGSSFESRFDQEAMPGSLLGGSLAEAAEVLAARHTAGRPVATERPRVTLAERERA